MHISELAVKRPVFAIVVSLLLVVVGLIAFTRLAVREYPNISPPIVSVETGYPGASAAVVDTKITQILEDRISGIEGIRTISSSSVDGRSSIEIEFALTRDIDSAANDVRERIGRALDSLPQEADPPEIYKVDSSGDVIMWLNLASDNLNGLELTDYANRFLIDPLSTVSGVARVRLGGARDYSMRVWLSREAMAARGVTAADVEAALRAENVELPAGRIDSRDRYFVLRTERLYGSEESFRALVVREGRDGHLIRLGEVAKVEVAPVETRQELRGNAQDMVGLGIVAQSTANTLEVARAVRAKVESLQATLPEGTRIFQSFDTTLFIEESISEIYRALTVALILVVLVIFLFLGGLRPVLVPAITVPISLIASLSFLWLMGYSINLLTLLALLLAIGLVVDDAIVVLENVYRRIQLGESPMLASVRGAKQVSFAVIATTLVLMAVFVPIGFLTGNTGRLFSEFAFAVAAGVGFSSFVALTLSPAMCSLLLGGKGESGRFARMIDRHMRWLGRAYRRVLSVLLPQSRFVYAAIVLVVGVAAFLYHRIPTEFTPREDRGAFFIILNAPEGTSYELTQRYMREVERELMPLVESGESSRILVRTPGSFGSPNTFNSGRAIVVLNTDRRARRPDTPILNEVRQNLSRLAGVRAFPVARSGLSRSVGQPVQFVIGGNTYEELREWQGVVLEAARANPFLFNVDTDYLETKPQFRVEIDPNRAASLGVPLRDVGRTLETFFGSRRVTTFIEEGEEYDVILQGADDVRRSPADLENVYVRSTTTGLLVPLGNIVNLTEVAEAPSLRRFNRLRAVTLSASLADGYTLGEALAFMEKVVEENLPSHARTDLKGESREFRDSQGAIHFVILLALVVVFLVLAAQFESFVHPLTTMVTVPLAAIGAFLGLYLFGASLNIFSQIGIVMLIGLAAKNGILLVEFANQMRDQGKALEDAVLTAAELRLRPILMTSISTVFGAIPLVVATGAGSENRSAIGLVIICGVTVATFLTLFLVPMLYHQWGRFTGSPNARAVKVDAEARATVFVE